VSRANAAASGHGGVFCDMGALSREALPRFLHALEPQPGTIHPSYRDGSFWAAFPAVPRAEPAAAPARRFAFALSPSENRFGGHPQAHLDDGVDFYLYRQPAVPRGSTLAETERWVYARAMELLADFRGSERIELMLLRHSDPASHLVGFLRAAAETLSAPGVAWRLTLYEPAAWMIRPGGARQTDHLRIDSLRLGPFVAVNCWGAGRPAEGG
jgi:hypothetical protein